MWADDAKLIDALKVVSTSSTCSEGPVLCPIEGCTNGACIEGMLLQQSWPWWLCEEQGIELQHCIACSGVDIASQSNAYAVSNIDTATTKIGSVNLTLF